MAQEAHDIGAAIRRRLHHLEEAHLVGNAADDRQMVAGQRHAQHRRLPTRGVGAYDTRQQIEARSVYPDDGATRGRGFF
jgi:hypothetical protein